MKKSFRVLLLASALGIFIAIGLNVVTVKTVGIGPDGYEEYRGFPFLSCIEFIDSTNSNNSPHCSYGRVIGNALVAFFAVYGAWGNVYFLREVYKKKS